jgi:hypothetical protein
MAFRPAHLLALACALVGGTALAETRAEENVKRDVIQQKRIERGLETGQLNAKEAGKLEREQQVINRMEAGAMKDGRISASEQRRLDAAKDRASQDIRRQKHDAQTANPNSASSKRMESTVERNVIQQKRIHRGLETGQMTNREAAVAESGQAHSARRQANAAAGGHVSAAEQARIEASQDRRSKNIRRKKHNDREQK